MDMGVLFADMRGSTETAERIGDRAFTDLINRFFQTSSNILIGGGAVLGRLAGDGASGFFVPGLAGPKYARAALDSAGELLKATGHGSDDEPWIPLGVGVHAGHAYLGLVGTPGGTMELTALGDDINVAARLADAARAGEILATLQLCQQAGLDIDHLEHRELSLKGKGATVEVVVITPT